MSTESSHGPDVPRLPESDQLAHLLLRLGSRSFAYFGSAAFELGLPTPVALALQRIEPGRPGPMHELAGAMRCDPSYITWIADQLEAHGLAERQPAPHDRRVKVLALTEAGKAVRERLLHQLAQLPFAIDHLTPAESDTLSGLLTRIVGPDKSAELDHRARFSHRQNDERRRHAAKRAGGPAAVRG